MTHEEKVNYLRLTLGICEVKTDLKTADLILQLCDLIKRKKDKTNLRDAIEVFTDVRKRYPEIEVKAVKNTPEPEQVETINNQ
jgi:hypothetical protein